ncbi:MAG: prephenate dehydrogenase/arogenate dehydrogenase family protein [Gammaproteobacteria bacterium]
MSFMDLEKIRIRISELDDELISLIAEREKIVEEVVNYKLSKGLPIRDFSREKRVIERARESAKNTKINPDMIEKVMYLLIESSLSKQEKIKLNSLDAGRGKSALVIGGLGKMGQWMDDFLSSQGYKVLISDNNQTEGDKFVDLDQSNLNFDLICICTPLSSTKTIIEKISNVITDALIIDIASLKSPVKEALTSLAKKGYKVASVHPMFGPDTKMLSQKHIVIIDVGNSEAANCAQDLFASTMVNTVHLSLDEHDKLMGYILGLSHIINIAFLETLVRSNENLPRLNNISSTTFDAQLEVATKVISESPKLYYEIQKLNNFGAEPLSNFIETLEDVREIISKGKEPEFINLMLNARKEAEGLKRK